MSSLPESRRDFGLRRLWVLLFTELIALAKWGLPGRLQWGIRTAPIILGFSLRTFAK